MSKKHNANKEEKKTVGFSYIAPPLSIGGLKENSLTVNVSNTVPEFVVNSFSPQVTNPAYVPISPDIGPDPSNSKSRISFEKKPWMEAVEGIRFDFAFGYRIFVPEDAPREEYEMRMYDTGSGMFLESMVVKRGNFAVGEKKYYIPYRIEIWAEGQMLFAHDYDCAGKRVYVVIPDGGLGDNLAWLPLVDMFQKKSKADVCCIMGEWMRRLAGDLYPGLNFIPSSGVPKLSGAYANYFCGIFAEDYHGWRPVYHQLLGMQGAVEAILGLPQGPVKCRLHLGSKRPFPEPYVCISSMGTNPGKNWNYPDGWNIIIRFLKSYGYRVLDIDRDNHLDYGNHPADIPSEAEDFTGRLPLQERIQLLEHADFFIGLPSGLSWLAWNCNVPVVMLVGFTMPNCEFPTPYRVTNYFFCHGCWNDSSCFFDQSVAVWCPRHAGTPREIECTRAITPKMVRETILTIPAFQKQMAVVMEAQLAEKGRHAASDSNAKTVIGDGGTSNG